MAETATLTKKDFASDQTVRWCPGCGDYGILTAVQKTMPELGIPRENIAFISGIGCSSRFPYYMNAYGFHTIHGRASAVASGVKVANPRLKVWQITGDGDALALLAQLKIRNPQQADYLQAKALAEKSVKTGSRAGEIVLARVLVNQQAGTPNYPHAISLLQHAAQDPESDSAIDAQMLLGLIYASGVHPPEDDVKATQYFKESSALSRTGYAEYWAGMLFQQGEKGFIEPNKQKALHWLNVSCQEGFDTGCEEFDRISKR